jgi:hypothetical protein
MRIDVSNNIDEVLKKFESLPSNQVAFAMSLAINNTAKKVAEGWTHEMSNVFDRPTPFTLRSPIVSKRATKQDMTAVVKIKDWVSGTSTAPAEYLQPQVHGGSRLQKRFETVLKQAGIMFPGEYAVPASGAKLDQYGNMSRGEIVKIISFLQAFNMSGFAANITDEKRKKVSRTGVKLKKQGHGYFVVRHRESVDRHLARGIWKREGLHGMKLIPVVAFVRSVSYRKRFDPIGVAQRVVKDFLPSEADRAIRKSLETMR